MPFYAITLLAGLQTVSPELHEAAAIDGANAWQRFWRITWPLLLPVTMVVTLFSVIQTFADFQLVYVLTGGGPANATHLFATYAYQIGINTGLLGEGAAASLAMFPMLFLIVVIQLWYIRRVEGADEPRRLRRGDGRGPRWKKWLYFYIPLTLFMVGHPVPLLLDARHRLPARRRALPAVAGRQQHPVLDPPPHPRALRVPLQGDDVRLVALQHDVHRRRLHAHLDLLRPSGRLRAGAAALSRWRAASARASSSRTWSRRRSCSSPWPTSSAASGWATRPGR